MHVINLIFYTWPCKRQINNLSYLRFRKFNRKNDSIEKPKNKRKETKIYLGHTICLFLYNLLMDGSTLLPRKRHILNLYEIVKHPLPRRY